LKRWHGSASERYIAEQQMADTPKPLSNAAIMVWSRRRKPRQSRP
jgi:hypothetical protein